jgi:signal transduction histidine kinase
MPGKPLSIRARFFRALFVTTVSALTVACLALITYEFFAYRRAAVHNLSTLAKTVAANSSALIVLEDHKVAQEVLSALKAEPEVSAAGLYTKDGTLFSTYPPTASAASFPPSPEAAGLKFAGQTLKVFEPVTQAGARVGTLFIQLNLRGMYNRLLFYGVVVLCVMGASAGVALLISGKYERRLSQPILDLAGLARHISQEKDFSKRAALGAPIEELTALNEAFNEMLEQIHLRDVSLQRHAETLEVRVAERTKTLEETTQQLYDFSYSIAHDLKAPIRAQAAYARLLLDEFGEKLGGEGSGFARRIAEAADRQSLLVSDLLAHVSLSRSDLPETAVDLALTAKQVCSDLKLEIERQQAAVDLSGVAGRVNANPASLHLVVLNLFSNSLKFVPAGGKPRIRAWTEKRGEYVRFWVEDNGIGIAARHLDKIFTMFQRLHTREQYPGTGMGLALVKRAAERMQGRVGVESEEEKGSRFWIELKSAD